MALYKTLLLCMLSLIAGTISKAQPVIEINKGESRNVGRECLYFIDSSGKATISDLASKPFVSCKTQILNLGNIPFVVWIKFDLASKTESQLYLDIQAPLLENIEVYAVNHTTSRLLFTGGFARPFHSRPVYYENWLIPVSTNTAASKIFIKANSGFPFQVPIVISAKDKFIGDNLLQELFWGLYIGMMLFALIYNTFIYISVRERRYLYYIMYVFLSTIFYLSLEGFTFMFIWPHEPAINLYLGIIICFTNIFVTLFTQNFLKITKKQKIAFYAGRTLIVLFLAIVLVNLTGNYKAANGLAQMLSLVACLYYILTGFSSLRRKMHDAEYFVIAWTLFLAFVIIFILTSNNVIESNFFTTHCIFIGHMTEVLLLSFALANRINSLKKENERFQSELVKAHIEVQEQTFNYVSQEIHDNLGQALTLVKLNINTIELDREGAARAKLDDTKLLMTKIIQDLRDISKSLNTDFFNKIGLATAVEEQLNLLQKSGFAIEFQTHGEQYQLDPRRELFIYRILQELINNTVKHAKAAKISIHMYFQPDSLVIFLRDDGIGFDVESMESGKSKGIGISNINNRVGLLKGEMQILSSAETGTEVKLNLPRR